jgi:hypothetical protein
MRLLFLVLSCSLSFAATSAQQASPASPTAETIMAQVAANQDQSVAERAHYLYVQHARVSSRKGKQIRCEEITDTRITPTPTGSQQQLLKMDGHLLVKHQLVAYTQLPNAKDVGSSNIQADDNHKSITIDDDDTMDRDLVENMRNNLTNTKSKDGIGAGLFPLTSKTQAEYRFQLLGREHLNGREVFHLTFLPKDKEDFGWKGDAYIDTTAYQPVLVRTTMSRKIPFAVRTLLGTSLPNLGFTVIYAPQRGGVWFPVSFGTEFKLHVLFFINREIVMSVENREFEKTHVTSTILPVDMPQKQ